jgi:transcriptional regulator with XRE-family HTH domain
MVDSIGKRIAFLRQKNGWTQQSLADRLAMSRVAISHMEMDLTIPSERSITLMAGIFKLSPIELVEGTTYPEAKMERLPEVTTTYTELEMNYTLLKNDIEWLNRVDDPRQKKWTREVVEKWSLLLVSWDKSFSDEYETKIICNIRKLLKSIGDQ